MDYDKAEFYRLCEEVPTKEEMTLAELLREEFEWEDEAEELQ